METICETAVYGCGIIYPNQTIVLIRIVIVQFIILHFHDAAGDLDFSINAEGLFITAAGGFHIAAADEDAAA